MRPHSNLNVKRVMCDVAGSSLKNLAVIHHFKSVNKEYEDDHHAIPPKKWHFPAKLCITMMVIAHFLNVIYINLLILSQGHFEVSTSKLTEALFLPNLRRWVDPEHSHKVL